MKKERKYEYGFTLIELIIAACAAAIVVLSLGIVLVDNQKGYNRMFDKVFGDVASDSDAARRTFDSIVRKSSVMRQIPEPWIDGELLEVYYYNGAASVSPDRYARFYRDGKQLMVDYGNYDWAARQTTKTSSAVVARNVSALEFSMIGASIHMVLYLDDKKEKQAVTTSAVRHN